MSRNPAITIARLFPTRLLAAGNLILFSALALGIVPSAAESLQRVPPDVLEAARRTGSVRVIVKVDQPEGQPIDRAQDVVLGELTGTAMRLLHRYLTSPFLALEVREDALRILDRSPH